MQYQGIEYDLKFKVLIVGEVAVGKTSLLRTLTGKEFKPGVMSTVGIDFVKKGFDVDDTKVLLEIWDTAGQERFRSITKFHYRGTKGIVLVYDITNQDTVDTLNYWIESIDKDLDQNNKEPVPVFIVGNKNDLETERRVPKEQGEHIAYSNFVHGFQETSAKENNNVHDVFSKLAYAMVEINDPAMLKGYEHLAAKHKATSPATFTISEETNKVAKKKKKKRKDYTRNANSIMLSPDEDTKSKKHSCVCHKS